MGLTVFPVAAGFVGSWLTILPVLGTAAVPAVNDSA
jgi:hypothetical protein